MRNGQSRKQFEKAGQFLVGGVNSPVRSFKGVGGNPLVMKYGRKAKLFDYDNNAYTDYCLSWGALILGHASRNVILAAKRTMEKGSSFGTTTRDEIETAEHIVGRVPSIERIRFVNSGTEATMSAVRLARGFTGRDLVIKFDGCYHGHVDALLTAAGSGVARLKESSSAGIPRSHIEHTISLPYNDVKALADTINQHKDKIACVIVEPVAGNMGVIPGSKEFLQTMRGLTKKHGIVLIFDEIMTGFRTHPNCVQTQLNIIPDMTCLGKIIGGGFPVGAYGGRKEIMEHLAPQGSVYQAGTFSGNPLVMRAGLVTLRQLDEAFYERLNKLCGKFADTINEELKQNKVEAHLSCFHSMMSLRFRPDPVTNYKEAQDASGGQCYAELFQYLLKQGIYWPPADLEAFFVSSMHQKSDLDHLAGSLIQFFKSEKLTIKEKLAENR